MTAFDSLLLLSLLAADPLGPGDHTRTLMVGELERRYLVHIPAKHEPETPASVVLVYHGGGSNAEIMVQFSGMNAKSDDAGFIAVYPNGTGLLSRSLTFNGGNCCGYALRNNVDDVEFTRRLLDDLATVVNVDSKRVFATGMSNGGIMTYRLASELSDRIAAIAPVGGPMGTEACHPKRPVPASTQPVADRVAATLGRHPQSLPKHHQRRDNHDRHQDNGRDNHHSATSASLHGDRLKRLRRFCVRRPSRERVC